MSAVTYSENTNTEIVVWRRLRHRGARWQKIAIVTFWAEALALAAGSGDYRFEERREIGAAANDLLSDAADRE